GVDDIRLLDGGYDHWVQAGNPVETILNRPEPVASFGVQIPLRPEVIIDIDEAKQILADQEHAALVSVRTWREHIGAVSGYNYIGPAGRIAGDVWGTAARMRTTWSTTATSTTRCGPTRRSLPTGGAPASRPTSGSPSTAAPAGGPGRPGSTPT